MTGPSKSFQPPIRLAGPMRLAGLALMAVVAGSAAACAPTVRVEVAPIQIYAKLDADVRVRLDQELQQMLRDNPNLF